jgi:hypothetical protein
MNAIYLNRHFEQAPSAGPAVPPVMGSRFRSLNAAGLMLPYSKQSKH